MDMGEEEHTQMLREILCMCTRVSIRDAPPLGVTYEQLP